MIIVNYRIVVCYMSCIFCRWTSPYIFRKVTFGICYAKGKAFPRMKVMQDNVTFVFTVVKLFFFVDVQGYHNIII